jgi:mono/diheme cytochrome c family protein
MLLSLVLVATLPKVQNAYGMEGNIDSGKKVYENRCLICHGSQGKGDGPAGVIRRAEKTGRVIEIYPRDFNVAVFRFRTTPTGCLPTDEDLLQTISDGIERSFMPAYKELLSDQKREDVKAYLMTLSERWEEEDPCDPITVKMPKWVGSPSSVAKGEKVYKEMKCWECHGYQGVGDGPKANELKDDAGKQILPFDFTTGALKRGSSPENIYITFTTGLDGTGMPAYEDAPPEKDRWHLVSFTLKLMHQKEKAE